MTAPTPPAPTPPPPLSDSARTGIRIILIVAATLLVTGSLGALGALAWGVSTFRIITDSQRLPAAMRSLVIDTANVPVAIRLTTDREIRAPRADLRLVNSVRANADQLTVTNNGSTTRVAIGEESSAFLRWSRAGEITITLPPGQARRLTVTTQQENGVLLAGADLDQLIAHTTNGPVILRGAARRIDVHTRHGDVTTQDPISVTEEFIAGTVDGDVVCDFKDVAPHSIEADSRNGDVAIAVPPRGPYLVLAQSGDSTRVRVPETTDPEDAVAQITARSDDGDVVVEPLNLAGR